LRSIRDNLTADHLREVLHYDLDTGVFTWRVATGRRVRVGSIAGGTTTGGYRTIGIDGRLISRIASHGSTRRAHGRNAESTTETGGLPTIVS